MTHGRMPITTWRNFAFCKKFAKNSDLFRRNLTLTVRTLHVSRCLRFRRRRGWLFFWPLNTVQVSRYLGARRELPASPSSPWDSQRLPEPRVWRKLQDFPFEQYPFAFHWKHSPTLLSTKDLFPLWPFVTAPLSTISFWTLTLMFLRVWSICNFTHILGVWQSGSPPHLISPWLYGANKVGSWVESCNFDLYRNSKILSAGGSLVDKIACSQRRSKSWLSSLCNRMLNRSDEWS